MNGTQPTVSRRQWGKRLLIMLVVLGLIFGTVVGALIWRYQAGMAKLAHYQPPPVAVSAEKIQYQTFTPQLQALGSTVAVAGVQLAPEVAGVVQAIYHEAGDEVRKGDVLVQLDDTIEKARLQNAQAALQLAKLDYQRKRLLQRRKALAQSDVDKAFATEQEAQAQVAQYQAMINQKRIKAPFSGRLGIWQMTVGQYLSPGAAMVSLQQLSPIYVRFTVPEQQLTKLTLQQQVLVNVQAFKQSFQGKISGIDSRVNPANRMIEVQATVANRQQQLLPGFFAQVNIPLATTKQVITVPRTAIDYNPYGDAVYVIKSDKKDPKKQIVKRTFVQLGQAVKDRVVVISGIEAGSLVVTSGQLKLHDGAAVTIATKTDANDAAGKTQ